MEIFTQVLGYLASICIPLAFLPQTIKIIKTRNTSGLSLTAYTIYQLGGLTFLVFGILRMDIPMITCQAIIATLTFIVIGIIIYNLLKNRRLKQNNLINNKEENYEQ